MSNAMYKVGTVARIAKVTVRTLHHYDEIGLLIPSGRSGSGYRLYTDDDVRRLQQIRFHREFVMALEDIRMLLVSQDFDVHTALQEHRKRLRARLRQTQALIATIDRMLGAQDGGRTMTDKLFGGFTQEEYAPEAKERWGDTPAWEVSQKRVARYTDDDWRMIKQESESIVEQLATLLAAGEAAESPNAMSAAEQHRLHIDRWFYACSPQIHAALSEMYVNDPRFAEYFEKRGKGLSAYVAEVIQANAARS